MIRKIGKNAKTMRAFQALFIFMAVIALLPFGMLYARADTIETSVPVGGNYLNRIAVNEQTHKIYVSRGESEGDSRVTVINGDSTDYTPQALTVGRSPRGMAIDVANNKIYVANRYGSGSVSIIDGATNVVNTMPNFFFSPMDVAFDSDSQLLYVLEYYNSDLYKGTVKVVSGTVVTAVVKIAPYPVAMVLNDVTKKIYVVYESGNVQVIDTSSGNTVTTIDTEGSASESIAVDTLTNKIYVANGFSQNVTVIDGSTDTVAAIISLGGGNLTPWGVTVNESTNKIYVANQGGSVSVIDGATNTVVQTISIPGNGGPIGIAADSAHNKIYVISNNTNDVTVIDGSAIEAVDISGLTAPALGETPQTSSGLAAGDSRYAVSRLTWENLGGESASLDGGGNFANAANSYQARIELTAAADYRFPASGLTPTVNIGLPADVTVETNGLGNKLTFVVTFPADITAASLLNLEAPATGATPAVLSDLISGNPGQYTLSDLTWEYMGGSPMDSAEFLYGGSWYQARIELTSLPGFKFPAGGLTPDVSGDGTASQGTVSGGDVSGNSLSFVVNFSEEIGYIYIEHLNPPAVDATPSAKEDLTVSSYCDVSNLTWENSDGTPAALNDGKFISGGSSYRAVIELTSQAGYKFPPTGDLEPGFSEDGRFDSGNVTGGNISGNKFTFTVTYSTDITMAEVGGLVAPATGEVPIGCDALTFGNSTQYYVDEIEWYDSDYGGATLTDGKFNANSSYIAAIYLIANDGFKFPDGLTPAVNAGTPSAGLVYENVSGNTLVFVVTFDATGAASVNYTIAATAGSGGSISPSGSVSVAVGENQTFTITPNSDYNISAVTVDGVNQGAIASYTFHNMSAGHTISATFTYKGGGSGGSSGGGSGGGTTTVKYEAVVSGDGSGKLTVTKDADSVSASASLPGAQGALICGGKSIVVTMPEITGVTNYSLSLPVSGLSSGSGGGSLTLDTGMGSITFPSDMLTGTGGATALLTIGKVETSGLMENARAAVGKRPVISLSLSIDGKQTDWNNPDAPVTVSIPYTPANGEDLNAIVIWYIDGNGGLNCVTNGRYDPKTGMATFRTTHFSYYAVGYNSVSFTDVPYTAWYYDAVSYLAAREITSGTGDTTFSPGAKLTRGEFIVMLVRACGISPDESSTDNFSDAGNTYYTGYLAAARRLGISAGVGNNLFAPGREITRQEMFTLLYNALKVIGQLQQGTKLPDGSSGKTLTDFTDAGRIDSWAEAAMTLLVKTGIAGGSGGKLSPTATATRAEMAQVLYNLLAK